MEEVPSKVPVAKLQPPQLMVKKVKEYSEADFDKPCIVIEDSSCETVLPLVKEGIVGINRAGIMSILNGAVPPTQSWVRYIYRQQEQPVGYAEKYQKQAWLLAEISDMLLGHALTTRVKSRVGLQSGPNIDYPRIKSQLMEYFGLTEADFSDSLSLPTIRLTTPSFMVDPVEKYLWAMKVWMDKLKLKEEAFEAMLEVLDVEEKSRENDTVQYVTEVYDYSMFKTGVAACAAGPDSGAAGSGAFGAEEPTGSKIPDSDPLRRAIEHVVDGVREKLLPGYDPLPEAIEHVVNGVRGQLLSKKDSHSVKTSANPLFSRQNDYKNNEKMPLLYRDQS